MKRGIRRSRQERRLRRGKASDYIQPIDEIKPGDKVVLCCRVSRRQQRHGGNLADQEANLREVVATRGACVADVVQHTGPGHDPSDWLCVAAMLAERHEAKLLAETTNRFIRHPGYHSVRWPEAQAREHDLLQLRRWTEGVTLVTVLAPDADWKQERSYHTRRGQRQKGHTGGRPRKSRRGEKKQRRLEALPKVKWMKWVGMSNRKIGKCLGTDESNVRRWGAAFSRYEPPTDGDCTGKAR